MYSNIRSTLHRKAHLDIDKNVKNDKNRHKLWDPGLVDRTAAPTPIAKNERTFT